MKIGEKRQIGTKSLTQLPFREGRNTNPNGKNGKPFSLYPHTFDEVVQKMLATPPPKHQPKAVKKTPKKVSRKK